MHIEPLFNHLIVSAAKDYEDTLPFLGGEIYVDPTYHPHEKRRTHGVVMQLPKGNLNANKKSIEYAIGAREDAYGKEQLIFLDEIVPEIKVGDKVYFHYLCLLPQNRLCNILQDDSISPTLYVVGYDKVMCAVRYLPVGENQKALPKGKLDEYKSAIELDENKKPISKNYPSLYLDEDDDAFYKKIIMIGGRVLVTPIMESRLSLSGIIINRFEKPKPLRGIVECIGTPLKCDPTLDVKAGDEIIFTVDSDIERTIEGQTYFVMNQHDIIGVVPKVEKEVVYVD
jgi:co-chaperonin GroES (HSP10)